jgi:hypothetical protein
VPIAPNVGSGARDKFKSKITSMRYINSVIVLPRLLPLSTSITDVALDLEGWCPSTRRFQSHELWHTTSTTAGAAVPLHHSRIRPGPQVVIRRAQDRFRRTAHTLLHITGRHLHVTEETGVPLHRTLDMPCGWYFQVTKRTISIHINIQELEDVLPSITRLPTARQRDAEIGEPLYGYATRHCQQCICPGPRRGRRARLGRRWSASPRPIPPLSRAMGRFTS